MKNSCLAKRPEVERMKNCHFVLAVAREPFGLHVQFVGLREAPEHQQSARIRV